MYEAELDKIGNIKMTLETQVMNLESAAQNAETFMVMNQGKIAMAGIRVNTDIEKVDELMDEIKEEMEAANEISNALAQPVDPLLHDEDDLLAELEQMSDEDALGAPVVKEQAFPTVPNEKLTAIANASKKVAEELAMLEKELAGKRKGFVVVIFSRWSVSYRRVAAGPNRSRASEGGWDGGGMKRGRYRRR